MPSAFSLSAHFLLTFSILSSILLKLKVKAQSFKAGLIWTCPPASASSILRDGLQCTEHLKYMGTICGGTVLLNDLEEFGRFEADEKSIS